MARKKRKSGQVDIEAGEGSDIAVVTEEEDCNDFEAVLDCDSNGLLVVEGDSRQILWANRSAEKLLRKKKDKLLSEPFPEELDEGPMRTFDLNKKAHSVTWQGQPAILLTLTSMSIGATSFSTEWRLEAAEERAREAEEMVQELQSQLGQLRKGSGEGPSLQSLQDHEAELKAELLRCQQRLSAFELEVRQAEGRAERAEDRAREAESLMEEAESQSRETERHLEDLSDSVRQVEEQLEAASHALQEETRRTQRLESELKEAQAAGADKSENEALQAQIDDLIQRICEQEQMALEASAQVGERDLQLDALRDRLQSWEEKQTEWRQREAEIEELEGVHLQVITELEQLREERQNWQEVKDAQVVQPGELEKAEDRLNEALERLDFLEIERSELEEKWLEARAELEQAAEQSTRLEQALTGQLEELRQQLVQLQESQGESQAEVIARQAELQAQLEASQSEHAEAYLQLAAVEEHMAEVQAQLTASQDECTAVQVELATSHELAGEAQQELASVRQQLTEFQNQANAAQAELASAQADTLQLHEKLAQLEAALTQGGSDAERGQLLEQQLGELQLEAADLAEKNVEMAGARDSLQVQLDELQALLADTSRAKLELEQEKTQLAAQREASEARLHELEALLLETEQQSQSSLDELAFTRQQFEELRQSSTGIEEANSDLEDLRRHVASVEKERDDLMRRLDRADSDKKVTQGQIDDLAARLEAKEAEAEDLGSALADLESQLNQVQDAYEELKSDPKVDVGSLEEQWSAERQRLLGEAEQAQSRLQELQSQIKDLSAGLEASNEQLLQLQSRLAEEDGQSGPLQELLSKEREQSLALAEELSAEADKCRHLEEQAADLQAEVARLQTVEAELASDLVATRQRLETAEGLPTPMPLVASIPAEDPRLLELESLLEQASQFEPEVLRLREIEAAQKHELAELRGRLEAAAPPEAVGPDPRVAQLEATILELQSSASAATPGPAGGNKETEQLAFEDTLTKLSNFNLLKRYLDFNLKQVDRYQRRCALIHVDVDRFQALNEALGVEAGDEVLRQVAERLQKVVRTSDVLCRKGEDDFLILLSEVSGDTNAPESISIVLKRIQEMMASPIQAAGQPILVSVSIGVSQFPSDAEDGDKMLIHAYSAMRRAKELGRNQIQFYTEELQKRHEARATLEAELRKGLEARQFQLLYQPIVHLPTGAIKGVETLLRWSHPSYGLLTPDYFIEVADETGILVPLGRWVILQAAQQLYEWSRQGLDLFVTVNLSTRQFLQADLVDTIRRALESTGAPAHNFVVEVPESVQMIDIQRVQTILLALRQAGVRVALDRFGSGFSSLERLHSELITLLKVDRKFLFHAATNASALNVTVAALGLARGLRLRPVAVGVENATQLSLCRQLECEYVQGNLVYVPTDAAQIGELARAGRLLR
ncbi:EAL domain-containing protein [bacterium]|nr:EAL domain-containing protein [bacterium]